MANKKFIKVKVWLFCVLWLLMAISVAACLSFICEKIVKIIAGYETTTGWFWFPFTYLAYFQSHFIPSLIAITFLILIT